MSYNFFKYYVSFYSFLINFMKTQAQQITFITIDKMEELIGKVDLIISTMNANNTETKLLGDYVTEAEAKKQLNRKTTWFYNKRNTGELKGRKSGGRWYYRRSDIIKMIDNGKASK